MVWGEGHSQLLCVYVCSVCVCVNMHVYCIVKDLNLLVAVLDTT